jgi:hypothetical protein
MRKRRLILDREVLTDNVPTLEHPRGGSDIGDCDPEPIRTGTRTTIRSCECTAVACSVIFC